MTNSFTIRFGETATEILTEEPEWRVRQLFLNEHPEASPDDVTIETGWTESESPPEQVDFTAEDIPVWLRRCIALQRRAASEAPPSVAEVLCGERNPAELSAESGWARLRQLLDSQSSPQFDGLRNLLERVDSAINSAEKLGLAPDEQFPVDMLDEFESELHRLTTEPTPVGSCDPPETTLETEQDQDTKTESSSGPSSNRPEGEDEESKASIGSKRTILLVLFENEAFKYKDRMNSETISRKSEGWGEIKSQTVRIHAGWLKDKDYIAGSIESGNSGYWLTPKGNKLARKLSKE